MDLRLLEPQYHEAPAQPFYVLISLVLGLCAILISILVFLACAQTMDPFGSITASNWVCMGMLCVLGAITMVAGALLIRAGIKECLTRGAILE